MVVHVCENHYFVFLTAGLYLSYYTFLTTVCTTEELRIRYLKIFNCEYMYGRRIPCATVCLELGEIDKF